MERSKFVIYLATDGAGIHIIRSIFMQLHEETKCSPIDHLGFWAKAVAAKYYPEEDCYTANKEAPIKKSN